MDTLFRLVSLQSSDQQSYNSSRTSSSSRSSSKPNIINNTNTNNNNNNISNNTNNSSSNNNNNNCNNYYYYYQYHQAGIVDAYHQEECGNAPHFYMDEDFSSSSSSKQFHAYNPQNPSATTAATTTTATTTASAPAPSTSSTAHLLFDPAEFSSLPPDLNLDFSSPTTSASGGGGGGGGGGRWAAQLLTECARAVAARDSGRVQQLMWMLNELSSAYGDPEQKIAAYFLQGLFARLTSSGPRTLRTLSSAADRAASFESTRRTALRFQELSPWSSFGHVTANGAILEAFLEGGGGAQRLHILDLSSTTFCTQWPTLLEALATRSADDTPHLTITTVVPPALQRVMREIGQRMDKFARLMGVPFRFAAVHPPAAGGLADLDLDSLDLRGDGALLAVNCVGALRWVPPAPGRRDAFLAAIRRLEPRIVTVVEEEADLAGEAAEGGEPPPSSSSSSAAAAGGEEGEFVRVFKDALRFFSAYMDSLEESFPRTSNERLALERAAGRAVVDLVACPAEESAERRERAAAWSRRLRAAGFAPAAFSDDVADDVRSLLRRYREGWSMKDDDAGIFLAWKDQPVVWASAWRPSPSSQRTQT